MKRPFLIHVASVILFATILAGCTYTAVPNAVPLLRDAGTRSLSGASIMVTNAEQDDTLHPIPVSDRENSPFKANRRLWSQKLVESLARELSTRGARVRAGAPISVLVALPEIMFIETREMYQFRIKAAVKSSRGWSKEYTGTAEVSATSVLSLRREANRLASQSLANLVKEIMSDDKFLRQLTAVKS